MIVVDGDGRVIRTQCDFCGSQHNYRGGGEAKPGPASSGAEARRRAWRPHRSSTNAKGQGRAVTTSEPGDDLEMLLRRVLREELGLTRTAPAEKWRGGELVLRPGKPGVQEKSWPIESFFHKVVMIRNKLRTLEQQVNASDLPDDAKVKLQSYVTGCYGSLTSFNVLFADEDDHFRGAGGAE